MSAKMSAPATATSNTRSDLGESGRVRSSNATPAAMIAIVNAGESASINDSKRAIRMDSVNVKYYHTLVDVYFSQNSTRLAKELLEIMEKKFPEDPEALLKLAELYYLVMKYKEAIAYVNKALKMDESLAKGYYIKGNIYRESGDTARANRSAASAVGATTRTRPPSLRWSRTASATSQSLLR